jgi:hypothetical protein
MLFACTAVYGRRKAVRAEANRTGGGKPSFFMRSRKLRVSFSVFSRRLFLTFSPPFDFPTRPLPAFNTPTAPSHRTAAAAAAALFPTGVVESNSQFLIRNATNPTQWLAATQNYVLVPNGKCFLGSNGQSKDSGIGPNSNYTGTKTVVTGNFTACKMACSREDCRCVKRGMRQVAARGRVRGGARGGGLSRVVKVVVEGGG